MAEDIDQDLIADVARDIVTRAARQESLFRGVIPHT
jgi:hypothetical protein